MVEGNVDNAVGGDWVICFVLCDGGEQRVVGALIVGLERVGRYCGKQFTGAVGILKHERINCHE